MQPLFARGNQRTQRNLLRWQRQAQTDQAPRVVLRLQAIRLSLQGHTAPDIAKLLGTERTSVYDWICAWNEHQLEGLKEGHRSGRPARLNAPQRERIFDIVESGPIAYGFTTGIWTSPLVQHVIEEEFAVSYHPGPDRCVNCSRIWVVRCSVRRRVWCEPIRASKTNGCVTPTPT